MTEAQIADLDGVGSGSDEMWLEPAIAAMPRLMEERKRLLEALRGSYYACKAAAWCQECAVGRDDEAHMLAAGAAIAYAEEST